MTLYGGTRRVRVTTSVSDSGSTIVPGLIGSSLTASLLRGNALGGFPILSHDGDGRQQRVGALARPPAFFCGEAPTTAVQKGWGRLPCVPPVTTIFHAEPDAFGREHTSWTLSRRVGCP